MKGLDLLKATALPMAVETACRSLDQLGVSAGQTSMVHGGGTMMGFAAVQMGILLGARVVTTAERHFQNDYATWAHKSPHMVMVWWQGA